MERRCHNETQFELVFIFQYLLSVENIPNWSLFTEWFLYKPKAKITFQTSYPLPIHYLHNRVVSLKFFLFLLGRHTIRNLFAVKFKLRVYFEKERRREKSLREFLEFIGTATRQCF